MVLFRVVGFLVLLLISRSGLNAAYIVFRYDDFAADQRGVRETNLLRSQIWAAEQEMDALFAQYHMPYVVAIIPRANQDYGGVRSAGGVVSFAQDEQKIEFIKRGVGAGRIEVAQHGFSHSNVVAPGCRPGEFRERDYQSQLADITEGREILMKACNLSEISTFVPPWNAWADETAKSLRQAGFRVLSADRHYYHESADSLTVIPFTAVLSELESMVQERSLPEESIVVVLYHPFEIAKFPELGSYYFGIARFEKLLQKLSMMPHVKVVTLQQLAERDTDLSIERYRAVNSLCKLRAFWLRLLPEHLLPGAVKQQLYLTQAQYLQMLRYWRAITATLLVGLLMMGVAVRYLLVLVVTDKWRLRIDVFMTIVFCLAIVAELRLLQRGYHITGIRAIPIFLSAGFVAPLILRMFRDGESTQQVTALKQCKRKPETI
jgi:predicted deacetylase